MQEYSFGRMMKERETCPTCNRVSLPCRPWVQCVIILDPKMFLVILPDAIEPTKRTRRLGLHFLRVFL